MSEMHVGIAADTEVVVTVVRTPSEDGHGNIIVRLQGGDRNSGHVADWEISECEALEMFLGFCVLFGLTDLVDTIRSMTEASDG